MSQEPKAEKEAPRKSVRKIDERDRLPFSQQAIFRKVMESDDEICIEFLERVLGISIERIERLPASSVREVIERDLASIDRDGSAGVETERIVHKETECVIEPRLRSHGVRLDLYVKTTGRIIDVEMQASDTTDLGCRMRYYQGSMDTTVLKPREDYDSLPESYIIFVCRRDPFGDMLPRYTIEPICREEARTDVKARMHWLVLNAEAFEAERDEGIRSLLSYIETGEVDRKDPLVRRIDDKVDDINETDKDIPMIMTLEREMRRMRRNAEKRVQEAEEALEAGMKEAAEEAKQQALAQGLEQGIQQGIQQGMQQGMQQGIEQGIQQGEALYARLATELAKAGRIDDIERAETDLPYRKALFEEFGIS